MRIGDFSVEVIPAGGGTVRELASGHVLARPGQVYSLRLRNHGPLRTVAQVTIDGHTVSAGGLVLAPWSMVDLERPIEAGERGRFTVIAEGDETVFGPDGGRDNEALGLIEVRFRRELPPQDTFDGEPQVPRFRQRPLVTRPGTSFPIPPAPSSPPGRPMAPPEWTPPIWNSAKSPPISGSARQPSDLEDYRVTMALSSVEAPDVAPPRTGFTESVERAAGTGLTGSSSQDFTPTRVGALEAEATVIQLRLVIGSAEALDAPRPLPDSASVPARPPSRP